MFKNRAAQLTFVKTPKNDTETITERRTLNDAEIKMIKDAAKGIALYAIVTVVTIKFADAICEIATNHALKN